MPKAFLERAPPRIVAPLAKVPGAAVPDGAILLKLHCLIIDSSGVILLLKFHLSMIGCQLWASRIEVIFLENWPWHRRLFSSVDRKVGGGE